MSDEKTEEETEEVEGPVTPTEDQIKAYTKEMLANFVMRWCDGQVFSSLDIMRRKQDHLMHMVFMPLALGALSKFTKEAVDDIGLLFEYTDADGQVPGRCINGMPIFTSVRLMNKEDWATAGKAINKELKRRKNVKENLMVDLGGKDEANKTGSKGSGSRKAKAKPKAAKAVRSSKV